MSRFGVSFEPRNTFVFEFVPKHFASGFVEAEQAPLVRFFFFVGIAGAVQTDLEIRFCVRPDSRRQVEPVSPNDRTGMSKARNRSLPTNIFAGCHIPGQGRGVWRTSSR